MVDEVQRDVFYTLDEQRRLQTIDVMFNCDGTVIVRDYDDDSILLSEAAALNLQRLLNQRYPIKKFCPACGQETFLEF